MNKGIILGIIGATAIILGGAAGYAHYKKTTSVSKSKTAATNGKVYNNGTDNPAVNSDMSAKDKAKMPAAKVNIANPNDNYAVVGEGEIKVVHKKPKLDRHGRMIDKSQSLDTKDDTWVVQEPQGLMD